MKVLSLFDGMSCGQIALQKAGIIYSDYFASEIEKAPMQVAKANFPNMHHIGDVRLLNVPENLQIDLLIGGSPCQSFSFAGKRNGMTTKCELEIKTLGEYLKLKEEGFEFEGQSYLFWEYMRLAYQAKPKWFLLENVIMDAKWEAIISEALNCKPVFINSNSVSAQNRKRLYWTNIPFDASFAEKESELQLGHIIEEENIDFQLTSTIEFKKLKAQLEQTFIDGLLFEHIEKNVWTERVFKKDRNTLAYRKLFSQLKSLFDKSNCLTTSGQNFSNSGSTNIVFITKEGKLNIRPLNPTECERLQTVPDGYTKGVSRNKRIAMLGNGWTVDIIANIFKGIS